MLKKIMIDRKTLRAIVPPIIIVFIDSFSRILVFPLLVTLSLSHNSPLLPPDTPQTQRVMYLTIFFSIYPICQYLGSTLLGNLSDIINRKTTLVLSTAGLAISLFFAGIAVSYGWLIVFITMRALQGLFGGTYSIAMAIIVDRAPKEIRAKAISLSSVGYYLGLCIGSSSSGILANPKISPLFSPILPFFVGALVCAITATLVIIYFQESTKGEKQRHLCWKEFYAPFIRPFAHLRTALLFSQSFLLNYSLALFDLAINIFFVHSLHYSNMQIGLFVALRGIASLIASLFIITPLVHRYCTEKIFTYSTIATATLLLIQSIFLNKIVTWTLIAPIGILINLNTTCLYTNSSHAVGKHLQGWIMGMIGGSAAIAMMVGFISSNLADVISVKSVLLITMGAVALAALIMIFYRWRYHPSRLEEEIEL
jgi:MFS transporter, DHA1 family, tetracycline resistance protein